MYGRQTESLRKKLTSRVFLIRRLKRASWGAGVMTLCTATLALVHSAVEHCVPAWCRSSHTCLIDSIIKNALDIVTRCMRPKPT